ncbi:hypothetical protein Ahy_A10g048457 [Arachis hypogaea]|uniref:DUF223 domain-containing protein n=1 Tax=Arachis hypogaea TaxID=3818 RepID=A0A445B554_ARAHY|nr:hypothetical protein Ahy_A10g048457 [Arachis hypogaea]
MAPRYDLIKRINAGPEHKVWKLIVRVIRFWTISHFANSGMKAPIEMVVLDKESLLAEGNVYIATNFVDALNTIKFKPTRYKVRIHFKRDTVVRPIQDSSIPLNGFNFVPFKKNFMQNVIGQLASKGNLVEFTRDEKPSSYITIELDGLEGRRKLRVTLWQSFALDLLKYLEEHSCLTYVVILQMDKIKSF